jgi:drug/metabolite transporter (DMT)-like permease
MQWIIFFLILGVAVLVLPQIIRKAKSSNGKGNLGGAVMALGMAFTVLLDPAKKDAIENLEKENENGKANKNASGDPE